jgi:hypothetical protein
MLQLYSFDSGYSLFILGKDFWSGEKGSDIMKKNSPKHSFPFFYYHKINLHLDISIFEQLFFLCFLKYESFSNCHQSYYRSIGLFWGNLCKICYSPGIFTKYFDGNFFWKEIFQWLFYGHKNIIITHFY